MKKYVKGIFLLTLGLFSACGKTVREEVAALYPGIEFSDEDLSVGYVVQGDLVIFVFDEATWGVESPEEVQIRGTMTGWLNEENWNLSKVSGNGIWLLEKSMDEVNVPANSGQPEFKFVADGVWLNPIVSQDERYSAGNIIIFFPGEDRDAIASNYIAAQSICTNYESDEQMANFREITAGEIASGILFRSYNPVILSKDTHPFELRRLVAVNELMEENDIASIINLSDSESELNENGADGLYAEIMESGNIFYGSTSYKMVYYQSDTEDFQMLIRETADFILESEPPYLIHCRLGTDRTGVVAAVLEALMSASWAEIKEDYLKSNELGIEEFRSEKLLRYSLEEMLGLEISDEEETLKSEMTSYFTDTLGFSEDEVNLLKEKLSGK